MAKEQDFEIFSGNTVEITVSLVNSAGAPVSLVGATRIRWKVGKTNKSTSYIVEKELGSGITVVDAAGGILRIDISPANTEPYAGTFYHELEVVDSAGKVQTSMFGALTINPNLILIP